MWDLWWDKVALGQVSLRVFRVFPVSVIPPLFHTVTLLHFSGTRSRKGRRMGTFREAKMFRNSGSLDRQELSKLLLQGCPFKLMPLLYSLLGNWSLSVVRIVLNTKLHFVKKKCKFLEVKLVCGYSWESNWQTEIRRVHSKQMFCVW